MESCEHLRVGKLVFLISFLPSSSPEFKGKENGSHFQSSPVPFSAIPELLAEPSPLEFRLRIMEMLTGSLLHFLPS